MIRFAHTSTLLLAALAVTLALHSTPALALNLKSFISNTGSDANSCLNAANACATLIGAIAKTAAGGEISIINTGDYVPTGINKSINVTNDGGGEAGIVVGAFGHGIDINAGPGDVISLRGLVIDGQGVGISGIVINTASAVHIQNSVIRNFEQGIEGFAIVMQSSSPTTQLFVSDTIIFNNGSSATTGGIRILPLSGNTANVVLDRVHLENNVRGLWVDGTGTTAGNGSHVLLRDSVSTGNAGDGVLATSAAGKVPAFIVVERSTVMNNAGTGLHADGGHAVILVSDTTISRNGTGVSATNSGQLISYGNNRNNNNIGPEGAPTGFFSQM